MYLEKIYIFKKENKRKNKNIFIYKSIYLTQVATYKNFSLIVKTKINRISFNSNPSTVTA